MRAGIFASAHVVSGGGGITATFQQSAVNPANQSSYTFAAQPIGTASATRRVVVAVAVRDGSSTTGATIGGVAATIDRALNQTNGVAIVSAVVPTGTTADVVVTFAATATRCGIGVWTLSDGAPTGQTAADATTPYNLNVTTSVGDVVIANVIWVGTADATWTDATERYDEVIEGTVTHSGADVVATGTTTSISATTSANGGSCAAAYA